MNCTKCGAHVEDNLFLEVLANNNAPIYCADCAKEASDRHEAEERKKDEEEWFNQVDQIASESGIPDGYHYQKDTGVSVLHAGPIVRHVADWIMRHRRYNILLSGDTGMGKSTSAAYAAIVMISHRAKVRYIKLQQLLRDYTAAKMSKDTYAEENFFRAFNDCNLWIIDELVGKTKDTESRREFMVELLDEIADGEIKARFWLLGNFRSNSIDSIFGAENREPTRRRIEENFVCAGATDQMMKIFHVYKSGE